MYALLSYRHRIGTASVSLLFKYGKRNVLIVWLVNCRSPLVESALGFWWNDIEQICRLKPRVACY